MQKIKNIKYWIIATAVIVSVAVFAAVGSKATSSAAESSTSSDIAIVKKLKLTYPSETAGTLMSLQEGCVSAKSGLYSLRGVQYKPSPEEQLTREQIIALFDDIKVEEYFSGTSYARIESGKEIRALTSSDQTYAMVKDNKEKGDPEAFDCVLKLAPYTIIEIKKLDKRITISSNKSHQQVSIINFPKEQQKYLKGIDQPFVPTVTIAVGNSKYKCDLSPMDMQYCYLNGMQVHPGTGKYVIAQSIRPEPGSKYEAKLTPADDMFEKFQGTVRGGGAPKIEENVSITVGVPVSIDKFEIPAFAKNFQTKTQ